MTLHDLYVLVARKAETSSSKIGMAEASVCCSTMFEELAKLPTNVALQLVLDGLKNAEAKLQDAAFSDEPLKG